MEAVKEEIVYLDVTRVRPDPKNYRKTWSETKKAELFASVKEHGVQQPIWARTNGAPGTWLIIAGERRYKAALAAKHETIPAIIKKVATDQEALELSLIENDQREDVNPMEQAAGYQRYLDLGGHTPETLAGRFGQKLAVVRARLSLLKLSKEIQKALLDGTIEYGHGLLITRLKDPEDQKAFFEEIIEEYEPLTVAQAKERIDDYAMKPASAPFDSKTCATCTFRSKAQAGLFPEEAKSADACMDRSCFAKKTREHYQKLAKEMEGNGIKVLTTLAEVQAARKENALEIDLDPDDYNYPKKYKSMCATCDKRSFFVYEEDGFGGKHFKTGEICLDAKCLNTMNGRKAPSESSGSLPSRSSGSSGGAARQHAIFMRDRFLRACVPAKVAESETIQLRLIIYHLLCRFERFSGQGRTDLKMDHHQVFKELMKGICPAWKPEQYGGLDDQKLYAAVETIPTKQLGTILKMIVMASVPHTAEKVLLQITSEAGITLEKDFVVDEQFLQTKTKGELIDLAVKKFGLPTAGADMKKPEIVKGILSHNLVGKVPPEIAKECKLISFTAEKAAVKAKATKKAKKK